MVVEYDLCTSQMTTLSSLAKMFGTSPELSMLLMSSTNDSLMIWVSENKKAIGVLQPPNKQRDVGKGRCGERGACVATQRGEAWAGVGGDGSRPDGAGVVRMEDYLLWTRVTVGAGLFCIRLAT